MRLEDVADVPAAEDVALGFTELSQIDALPAPGATHNAPSPWEFYALGRIQGQPSKLSPAHRERLKELGLNDLRGPGAWASHDGSQAQTKAEVQRRK